MIGGDLFPREICAKRFNRGLQPVLGRAKTQIKSLGRK